MKKISIFAGVVILLLIGGFYFYKQNHQVTTIDPNDQIINSVVFKCLENKNIQAVFYKNRVELVLSDSRKMTLPQVISASGARYANSDESFVFWNKGDTAFVNEGDKQTYFDCSLNIATSTSLANPASVNCAKQGGNLVIQKRGDGGEYGLCYFEENRACEEWALMRGDCPVGGRKTTGYDSIDQNYCAWSGGQTFAVPNSICTFKDGSKCSTLDFYNGKCNPGLKD
jgi:putative hemolysin